MKITKITYFTSWHPFHGGAAELYLTDEEIAEIDGRNVSEPELVTAV
jgi:hypothetical protein